MKRLCGKSKDKVDPESPQGQALGKTLGDKLSDALGPVDQTPPTTRANDIISRAKTRKGGKKKG